MSPMIEFQQVSEIGKQARLKEVSFALDPGYIMGICGKNGAGKTSLLKSIVDPAMKCKGRIFFNGLEINKCNREYMNQIAYVTEEQVFQKQWTISMNGTLYSKIYANWEMELFQQYIEQFGIPMYRRVGVLSRGEYIKFQMAVAMAHHAKLFLLDEVTAGMDPVFRMEFFRIIRKLMETGEVSVIMATQLMKELEFEVDYIGVMEEGRMISFGEA